MKTTPPNTKLVPESMPRNGGKLGRKNEYNFKSMGYIPKSMNQTSQRAPKSSIPNRYM